LPRKEPTNPGTTSRIAVGTAAEDFGPPLRRRSRFTSDVLGYLRDLGQALGARPAPGWPRGPAPRRATTLVDMETGVEEYLSDN
jgi:hypothetical protein